MSSKETRKGRESGSSNIREEKYPIREKGGGKTEAAPPRAIVNLSGKKELLPEGKESRFTRTEGDDQATQEEKKKKKKG